MPTDYIMRMIEEFFRILRNIIMKREQHDYEMARLGLDNLSRMITGMGMDQLRSLGTEGIKYFFNISKAEDAEKVFCAAKMFKEEALINEAEGKVDDAKKSYEMAIELFRLIEGNVAEQDDVREDILEIEEKLSN